MTGTAPSTTRRASQDKNRPGFIYHPSFEEPGADHRYDPEDVGADPVGGARYLPDEKTRELAGRMHYAAFRWRNATAPSAVRKWEQAYYHLRDLIVIGNRKLVFKAVRSRMALSNRADDLIGDCDIVLIQAVAAYNPWLGIRFSTYAYTCLMRALARAAQRLSSDRLLNSLSLDHTPDGEPRSRSEEQPHSEASLLLEEFFREDHPLLSHREKLILSKRYRRPEQNQVETLEKVGAEVGLSKERVRQLQAEAIEKLRLAMAQAD